MITYPLMTTRRTLGTGPIVSEESTLTKSMQRLRDWQRHPPAGRGGRRKGSRSSRATRSCWRSCRRSIKSICLERCVKRRRPGRGRNAGTRRAVLPPSRPAPRPAAQSWATGTSPGRLLRAPCRRWWTWCCTAWTGRTCRPLRKRSGSSRRCGIPISSPSAVKLG